MSEASYWDEKWSGRKPEQANTFAKRAYHLIKLRNFNTLLDVGCGNGRDSIYFSDRDLVVTAVDLSIGAINALKNQKHGINCICEDMRNLAFKDGSFEVIYAHLSLHYFDDLTTGQIFNNLYKILTANGLLFIKCKSVNDPLFGQGEKVGEYTYKMGHVRHFFSKEYMMEKLYQFKILMIRKTSSFYAGHQSSFIEAIAMK